MKYFIPIMLLLLTSFTTRENADLVIYNAKIYTVSDKMDIAEAMAVKNGKILAIGRNSDIKSHFEAVSVIDLKGKAVFPGFIDSHCHFFKYACMTKAMSNLKGSLSFSEVLKLLKVYHEKYRPTWLCGRGWDQNEWKPKNFPDNIELDKLYPHKPVMLIRVDGHAVLVNSEAIRRAGITEKNIKNPNEAIYNTKGQFTGVFLESAADVFKDLVPQQDRQHQQTLLLEAEKECFSMGLTSLGDAGLDKGSVLLLDSLLVTGALKMRINVMLDPTEAVSYTHLTLPTTERV